MSTSAVPFGEFGDKTIRQVRVLEPGKYRVFRRESDRDVDSQLVQVVKAGTCTKKAPLVWMLCPLALTYSQKVSDFVSTPPLLSIANLNISHAQRNAQT